MATPSYVAVSGLGGSATTSTGAAAWSTARTVGQPLIAALWSGCQTTGSDTITVSSDWTLVKRFDVAFDANNKRVVAFYQRAATNDSSDDFEATVGIALYNSTASWSSAVYAFGDVVDPPSGAVVDSTYATSSGGTEFTPSPTTITRGTSLSIVMVGRTNSGSAPGPSGLNGYTINANTSATGRSGSLVVLSKAEATATTPGMPSIAVGDAAAAAISFAYSGIPVVTNEWGVDQVRW